MISFDDRELRQFFSEVYLKWVERHRGAPLDAKTITLYLDTIRWWERLVGAVPVNRITQDDVDRFITGMRSAETCRMTRMAPATARKHAANVRALLRLAAPLGYSPNSLGYLPDPLHVVMPRVPRKLPFGHMSLAEIAAIKAATSRLRSPSPRECGVPTAVWWNALLSWLFYTGSRIGETLLVEWRHIHGREVSLPAQIRKHGVPHWTYLHRDLDQALVPLRNAAAGKYVFAYQDHRKGNPRGFRDAIRCLSRLHERARSIAGVPKTPGCCWHAYRKQHLTELASINPIAAQLSSSHGGNSLMAQYYLDVKRVLREAIEQLPVIKQGGQDGHAAQEAIVSPDS